MRKHVKGDSLDRGESARVKVCHCSCCHAPEDVRIFLKECRSLSRAGYDVSIIVPYPKSYTKESVRIIGSPMPGRFLGKVSLYLFFISQFQILKLALREKATVYHFHDQFLLLSGFILRLSGRKVIYDVHEDYPRQIPHQVSGPAWLGVILCYMVEKAEHLLARTFSGIVTVTEPIQARFEKIHPCVAEIRNYPILEEFAVLEDRVEERTSAVYIGYISRSRGIFEVLEAIHLARIPLLLAGKFGSAALKKECEQHPGWDYVTYCGFLDRPGVQRVLSQAAVGLVVLHPNENYINGALPVKLFEYMAAAVPVIISDFPEWRRIVMGAEGGTCVDPLSPQSVAEAITFYVENPEAARAAGRSGREYVQQHFSWDAEALKLVHLYEKLLGLQPRPLADVARTETRFPIP